MLSLDSQRSEEESRPPLAAEETARRPKSKRPGREEDRDGPKDEITEPLTPGEDSIEASREEGGKGEKTGWKAEREKKKF
jgi:hypothetical protein